MKDYERYGVQPAYSQSMQTYSYPSVPSFHRYYLA